MLFIFTIKAEAEENDKQILHLIAENKRLKEELAHSAMEKKVDESDSVQLTQQSSETEAGWSCLHLKSDFS